MKPSKRFVALFLAPASLAYAVFFLYPMLRTFYLSFFRWSGIGNDLEFRWLGNFTELLRDDLFIEYALKSSYTGEKARIIIINARGDVVHTSSRRVAGYRNSFCWDERNSSGLPVTKGIYTIHISVAGFQLTSPVMII